ncbi:protein FAR1-RELATED SEQUENCE 12-like [Diospyros lotus]|uniref:protein FAR1-RELATED SEQUENCE 12-like n=1 Tax=Diospyros lotus TaxID=55363 RepID=UPI0022596AA8|nr:protein FAR1-RELATED SEQUENCE 12-like [Diospyros lotus]
MDNLNGNADIIKPSFENIPQSLESLEPCIGMVFESAEDAREFYKEYGQRVGFTIRNNRTRRSLKDKSVKGREFVCSKEGFRADKYANGGSRILPLRPASRGGCNAMLKDSCKRWRKVGYIWFCEGA